MPSQRPVPIDVSPVTKTRSLASTGAPPVALAATGTPSTATLTWQSPAGATGFDVYRAPAPSGNWVKLANAPVTVTSFTDASGFRHGEAYVYRVVSLFADGLSGNADLHFQPPVPQNPAWVKAIQQGSSVVVSWAPVPGATRYKVSGGPPSQGYRQIAAPGSSVTYQNVPVGSYQWIVGTSFDPGAMETPAIQWPAVNLSVISASTRYRVLITGLSVLRKTSDDPLHYDGVDDEVFVAAQAIVLDRQTGAAVVSKVSKSMNYGDVNNPPRIQAGSGSSHGGLNTGDKLPSGDPTQPSGQPTIGFPLLAFDGTLTDGRDEVLIFPSIWEIDYGNGAAYVDWLTNVPQMRLTTEAAPNADPASPFPAYLATGEVLFYAQEAPAGDMVRWDRPIGSRIKTSSGPALFRYITYQYRPRVFRLQREELEPRLATPSIAANGAKGIALSIQFKEDHSWLWGDYLLHLWIERVP
ncbi:MAG: fibronectin type III domain-containing protein [Anaerolineae bacterium]|nr:fibronectin type III domain-containing protein [Gemmatimonadaceae bacterium]